MQRSDFKHSIIFPIRWGDMDALGHVNNVEFFRYFESGRIAYYHDALPPGCDPDKYTVLADIQCAFRRQLYYPATVEVGTRLQRLGNSSMHLDCAIFIQGDDQGAAATGRAVIVWYDFEADRSMSLPPEVRKAMLDYEGMQSDHR